MFLLIGLIIVMFFFVFDGIIVGIVMLRIVGDFGGLSMMIWLIIVYLLMLIMVVLIVGKFVDLVGCRVIYVIGFIIFMVVFVLCGMVNNMIEFILFCVL